MRIVSLLPSATEIVYALGLDGALCAVSHECDYPPQARTKPVAIRSLLDSSSLSSQEIDRFVMERVSLDLPIYEIDRELLHHLAPDLILTQELCDVCAIGHQDVLQAIQGLAPPPRILSLNPTTLTGVLQDILRVGEAAGQGDRSKAVVATLERRIQQVASRAAQVDAGPRVVCLEWLDPPMICGHWVPEMVGLAGGLELLGRKAQPSRKVSWQHVVDVQPEVLVLMPCGYDVARTNREAKLLTALPDWRDLPAVVQGRVYACNGHAYFSRSGPRLVDGLEMLAQMLHPDLFQGFLGPQTAQRVDLHALTGTPGG